ncbi:MAG TPA: 50S ribosomal protein L3 [Candidatus Thermoplasmatota archaeon]|jgi:large subunit ribosomal protein L3|nr:50S ribosomal protein L3 [Candidatus Thermoplasmatota archaeon]
MSGAHSPHRGSHGFSPRKRAASQVPRFSSWPEAEGGEPRLQGFAGYKVGMTHALLVDYRPTSITTGQEVQIPVTIVEAPPLRVAAVRAYREGPYGLQCVTEVWTQDVSPRLKERLPVPKAPDAWPELKDVDDVRVLAHTWPEKVTGVPRKIPEVLEIRVAGGAVQGRLDFGKGLLGKDVEVGQFCKPGDMIDVAAVTKGFGFQGSPVRWGVKLQSHKNSKNRRDTTPLGPFNPGYVRPTVPMPGQTGYHQRTEYNKRVLQVGDDGAAITPAGGFIGYGVVRNKWVMLHGSIPGPAKRLIRLRDAARYSRGVKAESPQLPYVSVASKQGG